MSREFEYERLCQSALDKALSETGLTVAEFAYLTGTKRSTVGRWFKDPEDPDAMPPPFWVTQFLVLACLPGGLDRSRQVARMYAREARNVRA